jgi:hypothetical protein
MKSKLQRVIDILEGGGELTISSGHTVVMENSRLYCKAIRQQGNGPVEDVLLGLDFSLHGFAMECEKFPDDLLYLKAAELALTELKQHEPARNPNPKS